MAAPGSSKNVSCGRFSFVRKSPVNAGVGGDGFGTRPGSRLVWLSCPAGTLQSPIRIKALGWSMRNHSRPLAHASPRKPSVPDRVQLAGRLRPDDGHQVPGYGCFEQPCHTRCGSRPRRTRLTTPYRSLPLSALSSGPAGESRPRQSRAIPDAVGIKQGDRRRRPQSGSMARSQTPFRARRPVPHTSYTHPNALFASNGTSSLIT